MAVNRELNGRNADEIRAMWSKMIDIDLLLAHRQDHESRARAAALADEARAKHLDTLEAAALLRIARTTCNNNQVSECIGALDRALLVTARSGDLREQLATTIAVIYFYIGADHNRNLEAAGLAVAMGRGILARLGDDPRLSAQLERAIGNYHLVMGDLHASRQALLVADRDATRAWGAASPGRTSYLFALARLDEAVHDLDAANREITQAIEIWQHAWGPAHPGVVMYLRYLTHIERLQGQYARALADGRRALALTEGLGPDHSDTLYIQVEIGRNLIELGREAEAEVVLVDAGARAVRTFGADTPLAETTYLQLCRARLRGGLPGAVAALEAARQNHVANTLDPWRLPIEAAVAAQAGDWRRTLDIAVAAAWITGPKLPGASSDELDRRALIDRMRQQALAHLPR
jgi:tetratricopeptide (TPR) repeat protein